MLKKSKKGEVTKNKRGKERELKKMYWDIYIKFHFLLLPNAGGSGKEVHAHKLTLPHTPSRTPTHTTHLVVY
jgi:hypothetical protein